MATNYAKIYIKIKDQELTVEGDPTFVANQVRKTFQSSHSQSVRKKAKNNSKNLLSRSSTNTSQKAPSQKTNNEQPSESGNHIIQSVGENFNNWLGQLPSSHDTRDRILIAAYFNQIHNKGQKFHTPDIRRLFEAYDLSVPYISGFLDTMEIQKLIFKVSDSTRKGYRFTSQGEQYVKRLLFKKYNEE